MITACRHCTGQIRDCTAFASGRFFISWYHTSDGHERCRGLATVADPVALVHVSCRFHSGEVETECEGCMMAAEVSAVFHNQGRCIPKLCIWLHERGGLDTSS